VEKAGRQVEWKKQTENEGVGEDREEYGDVAGDDGK
jgi:hypothetical protein